MTTIEDDSLESYVEDYAEWVKKDVPVDKNWIDEINYLSFLRDEIHKKINKGTDSDFKEMVHQLDIQWQHQVSLSISKDFTYTDKPRGEYPDHFWWWHLDRLDELTDQQKTTL